MADINLEFSSRLREAIKKAGLSQKALARMIGVREVTISKYVKHGGVPEWNILVKISQSLNVSCDWLLTGQEPCTGSLALPAGKDYVDLPAWNQAPLDDEERELMGCALDVLRSGDKLPNVATALKTNIKSLRDTVERDANRPRPRAPSWESPGSQKQASGGGQQGKRRANGSD